ncbi:hypothetical protein AB3S75_023793 [Citrus x aurantiifolia]
MESAHAIDMPESKKVNGSGKGKAAVGAPAAAVATTKATPHPRGGWKKGVAIFDFVLRLAAVGAALGATATMGTADEILPFFTQFFQFEAQYDDFEVFMYVSIFIYFIL